MLCVALDPFVVALPQGDGANDFRTYVEGLNQWARLAQISWTRTLISDEAAAALAEEDRYPSFGAVQDALRLLHIEEIDAATLVTLAEGIFRRAQSLELACEIKGLAWDEITCHVKSSRNDGAICGAAVMTVALLAVARHVAIDDQLNTALAIEAETTAPVSVEIRNALVDFTAGTGDICLALVNEVIPAFRSLTDCLLAVDPVEIMIGGDSAAMMRAVQLQVLREATALGDRRDFIELQRTFTFGEGFAASICSHQFGRDRAQYERILRACADAALQLNLQAVHALRAGKEPSKPQQTRGRQRALRRDIDYEYHLHYWQAPGEIPEFSVVVVHEDFSI